jgi:hypothetical protein
MVESVGLNTKLTLGANSNSSKAAAYTYSTSLAAADALLWAPLAADKVEYALSTAERDSSNVVTKS